MHNRNRFLTHPDGVQEPDRLHFLRASRLADLLDASEDAYSQLYAGA